MVSRSAPSVILETPVKIIPLEELIWQKAYIMERERLMALTSPIFF
jgi:hypothetical protein